MPCSRTLRCTSSRTRSCSRATTRRRRSASARTSPTSRGRSDRQTNVDYTTYEYRDVGVILTITPSINTERFVRLKVNQEVSTIVQEESTEGLPTTLKRTAKTTIMIKDNQTIVIGGLMGDSSTSSNYQVPLLGDIPLLGWLFKTKGQRREKTNLLHLHHPPHHRDRCRGRCDQGDQARADRILRGRGDQELRSSKTRASGQEGPVTGIG